MRNIFLSALILTVFSISVFSQSQQQLREEANMDYNYTPDNSEYARLWQQQVDARKSGDMEAYSRISNEITQKYPEKFTGTDVTNQNILTVVNHNLPPFTGDWINGDAIVYGSGVGGTSVGNPSPFNRNIRLEADSLGNQYAAFLSGNNDTIIVYKSTTNGALWNRIFSILGSTTGYIHSFDMFVTDSASAFRLGFAITIVPDAGPTYAGNMYWISINQNGTSFPVTNIAPPGGRAYISPAIVSDGFSWSAGATYWYMTFQNCDPATGVTSAAILAMSTNWGQSWILDTARSSFNDYELDVDYNFAADTIYVLLTNNLTLTDENLRLRYVPLSGIGTGLTWKQSNTGATTGHDRLGSLTCNRQTNEMAILFNKYTGTNADIRLNYSPLGIGIVGAWTLDVPISALAGNEINPTIKCQERQGAYRISYVSQGSGFDTVVYMSASALPTFSGRQVVNQSNVTAVAPAVIGFRNGSGFDGGVLYAANNNLLYDGSALLLGISQNGNNIPEKFVLEQNYPNPFNPSTSIKFSVPQNGFITLKVYDIMGREVASLINNEMTAGNYTADFNASGLGSGVYFYKLTSNGFTDTKKMILVK
jgi:hypothetical protein